MTLDEFNKRLEAEPVVIDDELMRMAQDLIVHLGVPGARFEEMLNDSLNATWVRVHIGEYTRAILIPVTDLKRSDDNWRKAAKLLVAGYHVRDSK